MTRLRAQSSVAAPAVIAVAAALGHASPALGATAVGETFTPNSACAGGVGVTALQVESPGDAYMVGSRGVVTSWSFEAGPNPPPVARLRTGRTAGGTSYRITGESQPEAITPNTLNTFPTHVAVQSGDVIGFTVVGGGCARNPALTPGYFVDAVLGDTPPSPGGLG